MKFSSEIIRNINKIFSSANADGRNVLYEYEVYEILKNIGLEVPKYILVQDPSHMDRNLLQKFNQSVVLKIVSPDIAHKQKLGGVKIIQNIEPLNVQKAMQEMKEEVLSHFSVDAKPEITGFLLVEFVLFTQALGYETLFGINDDPAFGPVLTLSKGGDDAEFFARYYDPANLIIPPFHADHALKVFNNLKIQHKFQTIGHKEYLENMAKAASILSQLAYEYSYFADEKPEYVIKTMDINPFVITKDHRFVAVDGFAQFAPLSRKSYALPKLRKGNLESFFYPKGVAIIGVSGDLSKHSLGREIAILMHDLGREDLYFVNAKGGKITLGDKEYILYKNLNEINSKIELVVYAIPAQFSVDFIKELPNDGPKAIVLISGLPSDIKYSDFTSRLDGVLPEGMRIIGPNCIGVYQAPDGKNKGVNTFFLDEKRLEVKNSEFSNTALLTQSGALAITIIDKMKYNRIFKAVVSFGNKYDVKITDLVAYFAEEDGIEVISLYVEGLDAGEGRLFFEQAKTITKPIIVYKSGRTEAGAKAAASHTASMSGSYEVFKAACLQANVVLAEKIEDHQDYTKAFSLLAHKIPTGNRVAGVLNAGFESTVGADELNNLTQAKLSAETIEKLKKIDRHGLVDLSTSFLDVTPMANDRMFADFVETVLLDENVDCVFVASVPHSGALKSDPVTCHDPDSLANLLADLSKKYTKPIVVSINAGRYYQEMITIMEENGLPVYNDIRSSIKSLDRFVSFHVKEVNFHI